jgi:L-asparaginase/Glu-tRNA(Gln) amidotransferase subunit D
MAKAWIRELKWPAEKGTFIVSTSDCPGGYVYRAQPSGNSPMSDMTAFERAEMYWRALGDSGYELIDNPE